MPQPGLIITADDYGLNQSCNAGIRNGVLLGVVSSVHVLVNLATEEDMRLLMKAVKDGGNKCGIGLHLNTTWGKAEVQEAAAFKKAHTAVGPDGKTTTSYTYHGLDTYHHKRVISDMDELEKMQVELNTQFNKLANYLGGPDKIDAISSHHNIHLWDARFVQMIRLMAQTANIPVRSPLRWESGDQTPDPPEYHQGKTPSPLLVAALANISKAANQFDTIKLLASVLHPEKLLSFRNTLLEVTQLPVNNSGHWYGQPSPEAIKWFLRQLPALNEAAHQPGYTSELYMHLSADPQGDDDGYDYKMEQRYNEYATISSEGFRNNFVALKNEYGIRHGSYRKMLQDKDVTF